jgi:hypothetical protein
VRCPPTAGPTKKPTIRSTRDDRNFYKVEKWSRDGQRVNELLFAGSNLDKAKRIFDRFIKNRPRSRLSIRQRTRVLKEWPPTAWKKKAPDFADYGNRGGVVLCAFIWMKGEDSSSCGAMGKVEVKQPS